MIPITKLLFFFLIFFFTKTSCSHQQTQQNNNSLIQLYDSNFPTFIFEHPKIFIAFITSNNCPYCQKFLPIYQQLSQQFHSQNKTKIKFTYINIKNNNVNTARKLHIKTFPTLLYLTNGKNIKLDTKKLYIGPRTKQHLSYWLNKQYRQSPLHKLTSIQQYNKLKPSPNNAIIIFHQNLGVYPQSIAQIAEHDNYNSYYHIEYTWTNATCKKVHINDTYDACTRIMVQDRSIEIKTVYNGNITIDQLNLTTGNKALVQWIAINERPAVLQFDDRTISSIFQQNKLVLVLFTNNTNDKIKQQQNNNNTFYEIAQQYKTNASKNTLGECKKSRPAFGNKQSWKLSNKHIFFTTIDYKADKINYQKLALFLNIDTSVFKIVLVDVDNKAKYVMNSMGNGKNKNKNKNKNKINKQNMRQFIIYYTKYQNGISQALPQMKHKQHIQTVSPEHQKRKDETDL